MAAAAEDLGQCAGGVGGSGADAGVGLRVARKPVEEDGDDRAADGSRDVGESLRAGFRAAGFLIVALGERDDGDFAVVPCLQRGKCAAMDFQLFEVFYAEDLVVEPGGADTSREEICPAAYS